MNSSFSIDGLRHYHNALRATSASGYPNMSYYNPMNAAPPGMDMAGDMFQLYRRMYAQKPQQSLGIRRSSPYWK